MHNTQSCYQDLSSKADEKASTIKAKALKFSSAEAQTLKVESKYQAFQSTVGQKMT